MLYSKHSFTGKILRNTRVFYFIGKKYKNCCER
jgi:hypothetical protein